VFLFSKFQRWIAGVRYIWHESDWNWKLFFKVLPTFHSALCANFSTLYIKILIQRKYLCVRSSSESFNSDSSFAAKTFDARTIVTFFVTRSLHAKTKFIRKVLTFLVVCGLKFLLFAIFFNGSWSLVLIKGIWIFCASFGLWEYSTEEVNVQRYFKRWDRFITFVLTLRVLLLH